MVSEKKRNPSGRTYSGRSQTTAKRVSRGNGTKKVHKKKKRKTIKRKEEWPFFPSSGAISRFTNK